jgi:hypothetical protein
MNTRLRADEARNSCPTWEINAMHLRARNAGAVWDRETARRRSSGPFAAPGQPLPAGAHTLEVKVRDGAGNETTVKIPYSIPGGPAAPTPAPKEPTAEGAK